MACFQEIFFTVQLVLRAIGEQQVERAAKIVDWCVTVLDGSQQVTEWLREKGGWVR